MGENCEGKLVTVSGKSRIEGETCEGEVLHIGHRVRIIEIVESFSLLVDKIANLGYHVIYVSTIFANELTNFGWERHFTYWNNRGTKFLEIKNLGNKIVDELL